MKILRKELNNDIVVEECNGDICVFKLKEYRQDNINLKVHATLKAEDGASDDKFVIEGYASTEDIDRSNDIVYAEAFSKTIKEFLATTPILLFMHNMYEPIGKVIEASIEKGKGLYIKAIISQTESKIIAKIKDGILNAFSFQFYIKKFDEEQQGEKEGGRKLRHIREVELLEVSVVSIPMNRYALFSVSKAIEFGTDIVADTSYTDTLEKYFKSMETKNLNLSKMALTGKTNENEKLIKYLNSSFDDYIEEKAGKVLSKKNRQAVETAIKSLTNVINADDAKKENEDDIKKNNGNEKSNVDRKIRRMTIIKRQAS